MTITSPRLAFGSTGLVVSRLCFGSLQLRLIDATPEAAADLFVKALDLGVNFFDTAQLYGTQSYLGAALKRVPRSEMVIATRASHQTRSDMQAAFEQSLEELGVDYIDVYGFHGIADAADWEASRGGWEYILELKAAGRIRATMVTTHSAALAEQMAGIPEVDSVLAIHNITGFGLVNETLADAERAAQAIHAAGKAFVAMKPLAAGGHINRVDEALNFYVERPWVTSVAIGMQSIGEVEMNCCLIRGLPVPQEVRRRVVGQERRLIIREWCKACGQCVEVCPQRAMTLAAGDHGSRPAVDDELCIRCGYCALHCPNTAAKIISVAPVLT